MKVVHVRIKQLVSHVFKSYCIQNTEYKHKRGARFSFSLPSIPNRIHREFIGAVIFILSIRRKNV